MNPSQAVSRLRQGVPFLRKELQDEISLRTPFLISTPRFVYICQYEIPCNGNCIMCYYGQRNLRGEKRLQNGRFLSERQFTDVLRSLHRLGGKGIAISFTGGEPLMYRPIYDIVAMATDLGQLFSLTTNGYLLTDKNAGLLVEKGLFNIGVSLESIDPAINETLRPFRNGTRLAMEGIDRIIAHRQRCRSSISVNIKTTITRENFESYPALVKHYGKIPAVSVTPQPFTLMDSRMDKSISERLWIRDIDRLRDVVAELCELQKQGYALNIEPSALKGFPEYFSEGLENGAVNFDKKVSHSHQELGTVNKNCRIGFTNLFIESDGAVKLCLGFPSIGNIHENSDLEAIWKGEKAALVRKAIASCNYVCALSCLRKKPLWQKARIFLNR